MTSRRLLAGNLPVYGGAQDSVGHDTENTVPLYPCLLHFPHLSSSSLSMLLGRQPDASGRFLKGLRRLPSTE